MIKDEIKRLAAEQVVYKAQRKTVNFKGDRSLEPWQAAECVAANKYTLRHLYITYDLLRNKEPVYPIYAAWYQSLVDKMVEKYSVSTSELQEE